VNAAGKGNCGEEESIPLMLIEADAVSKVLFMYYLRLAYMELIWSTKDRRQEPEVGAYLVY
jgi:hypothetical protein